MGLKPNNEVTENLLGQFNLLLKPISVNLAHRKVNLFEKYRLRITNIWRGKMGTGTCFESELNQWELHMYKLFFAFYHSLGDVRKRGGGL
jgi:hypothetical protein